MDCRSTQRMTLTGHGIAVEQPPAIQDLNKLTVETGISILKQPTKIQDTLHGLLDLKYYHAQIRITSCICSGDVNNNNNNVKLWYIRHNLFYINCGQVVIS